MNEHRLDSLARNLSLARSRRGVLKAVAAVFVGSLLGSRAMAPPAEAQVVSSCGGIGQPCCAVGINSTVLDGSGACRGGAVCRSSGDPLDHNLTICICPDGSLGQNGSCNGCSGGKINVNGTCVCPRGMVERNGVCICPGGMVKLNDTCVCPTGQVDCNGTCHQCCTATDCRTIAHATPTCSSGTCRYTCDAGYRKCGGHCIPVTSPCNGHCLSTRTLVNGVCAKKCTSASQCSCGNCVQLTSGQFVCSGSTAQGTCVSTATCATGYACIAGGYCLKLC